MELTKEEKELLANRNTAVFVPEVGIEHKLVRQFLRTNAPKVLTELRMYTELSLGALQTDILIVVITRDQENPVYKTKADVDGKLHSIERPEADLMDEIRISKPVAVKDFWVRDNPMRPGKPDTAGILEAIGKVIAPWRFDFVDKGNPKPDLLKLTTM